MTLKAISGKIESQELNDNFSYLESEKRDKSTEITMSDLSQNVKENMTGGSVAVVGVNAVGNINLKERAVAPDNTTFVKVDERNLYNKDTSIDGYRLDTNGDPFQDPEYTLSEFIRVDKGFVYKVGFAVEGYNSYRITAYDNDKEFLKTLTSGTSHGAKTIDVNIDFDGFIRVPFELTGKNIALVAKQSAYDGFHPYQIIGNAKLFANPTKNSVGENEVIDESLTAKKTTFVKPSKNIFDKRKSFNDKIITRTTGDMSDFESYSVSDYIKVRKGEKINLTNPRNVAPYDTEKNYLGYDYFVDNPDNTNLTITPIVDGYIRTSFKSEYINSFQVVEGDSPIEYEPFGLSIPDLLFPEPDNKLFGKKLLGFGDSIARGRNNGYLEMIADKNNMVVANYGSDGATVAPREGYDNQIIKKINEAITAGESADYIIFNGLTNDANVTDESRLGEITTTYDMPADVTTFSGAFEELIKIMRDEWPAAKIIYVRPHNMDSRGDRQVIFGERAIEICKKWSIPVVDIYSEGNLNTQIAEMKRLFTVDTYSTGLGDGTHPTEEGYREFYVPMIESKMKSV